MGMTIGRFVYDGEPVAVAQGSNVKFEQNTISTSAIGYDGNGGILLKAPGIYRLWANFTTEATAANAQEIQMFENGSGVDGAKAIGTAAEIGDNVSLAFGAVMTVMVSNAGYATLTFKSANATSISVANVIVEKVR